MSRFVETGYDQFLVMVRLIEENEEMIRQEREEARRLAEYGQAELMVTAIHRKLEEIVAAGSGRHPCVTISAPLRRRLKHKIFSMLRGEDVEGLERCIKYILREEPDDRFMGLIGEVLNERLYPSQF